MELLSACTTGCLGAVDAVKPAWENHFGAFGAQDLDKILLDYCAESVIVVYNILSNTVGEFKGVQGACDFHTILFRTMIDTTDLAAPVAVAEESLPGSVFLVWSCKASGINYATDTFQFNEDGKIMKQFAVTWQPEKPASDVPVSTESIGGPVQETWDLHHQSWAKQDLDAMSEGYTEDSVIKTYNAIGVDTDTYTEYTGVEGAREFFEDMFAKLDDISDIAVPVLRVEEAGPPGSGAAGSVFLAWKCQASGFAYVTEVLFFDPDGSVTKHNVVMHYDPEKRGQASTYDDVADWASMAHGAFHGMLAAASASLTAPGENQT